MDEIKISIIIPVYNAEKTLQRCLDSVLQQTYLNYEIVAIDDGSTDSSGQILEIYANSYKNLRIFHQLNSGVSITRNRGIELAKGDFIAFVDSDDSIPKKYISELVNTYNRQDDLDLVITGIRCMMGGKCFLMIDQINAVIETNNLITNFSYYYFGGLLNSPCNKLYRKTIIFKNQIRFNPETTLGEDLLFNLQYLGCCRAISYNTTEKYECNYDSNKSLSRKYNSSFFSIQLILVKAIFDFLESHNSLNNNNVEMLKNIETKTIIATLSNIANSNIGFIKGIHEVRLLVRNEQFKEILSKYKSSRNIKNNIIMGLATIRRADLGFIVIYIYSRILKYINRNRKDVI